jgi:hypothetical protein
MAIKVGIVGYGFSTKCFHLPYILPNPDLEVYAFLQRAAPPVDASQMPRWGHCTIDFPEAKHYMTADEFFADESIELVIVCTHSHEEFIEKALLAGKHGQCQPHVTGVWFCQAEKLMMVGLQSPLKSRLSLAVPKPTGSLLWPRKRGRS